MEKSITLQNKEIKYQVRKSRRARQMRMTISCDGNLVITVPYFVGDGPAENFIREKARWIIGKIEYFKSKGSSENLLAKGGRRDYEKHKNGAKALVKDRLAYFNSIYGFKFKRVSIRNQRTRWGSCSRKGNMNFNYRIFHLPARLADYIIVHELCHLKEFNHSRRFWDLVAEALPDHKELRRELKKS